MHKRWIAAPLLLACVLLCACGSVGEPKFPARFVPNPVNDLSVVQQGPELVAAFTIQPLTTEGLPVKEISVVDLRVGAEGLDPAQWEQTARVIPITPPLAPSVVRVPIPAKGLIGKEVLIGVRIGGPKGRISGWSNFVSLRVETPLDTPAGVTARATAAGVELRWQPGNATAWKVFRMGPNEKDPTLLGNANKPEYLDPTASYGATYRYVVQAGHGQAESRPSAAVALLPEDTFPPAVPTGLAAAAGAATIELTWLRNTEPDFKEYRVYRAAGDGAFEMIAGGLAAPAYSDAKVESGKRYRYAVAAADQTGNVSGRCAPVEAVAP